MASATVTLQGRVSGTWRLGLVCALLRHRVYIPGSLRWAASGMRVAWRVDRGPWKVERVDPDALLASMVH